MIRKLRQKFICINMLIVVLMLFVILGMTISMTKNSLREESLEALRSSFAPDKRDHQATGNTKEEKTQKPNDAPPIPSDITDPTESRSTGQKSSADTPPKAEKNDRDGRQVRMPTFTLTYSSTGVLVAEGSDFYDLSDTAYLESLISAAQSKGTEYGILWSESLRFLRNTPEGNGYSFMDISSEQTTLWNLFLDCILIGFVAFVGFLLLSILLARWAIKPVETSWTQQQQFIADASHELKTPLTVIITEAELLSDPNIQEETRQQCSANILETSHRMRSLTEEMLNLARAENVQEELMEEICSLSELLEDSILAFEPLFFEKGLTLRADIEEGITVKGNRDRLRQLGEILLDNAQKYSLPGTSALSLKKQGHKTCELTLSNPAHPISGEKLERLFDRFYRADKARTATGSYGLGLSIARSIVHRHHGTIKAEHQDGTITFRIRLPITL